jgi:O-antigen/teichoic acid export membrane protein
MGSIIFITRVFSMKETGAWFMFIAIFALVSSLRDALIQPALVKKLAGRTIEESAGAIQFNFVAMFAFEMVANVCILLISFFLEGTLQNLLLIYSVYSLPNAWFRWQTFFLRAKLNTQTIAFSNCMLAFIQWIGFGVIAYLQLPVSSLIVVLGLASLSAALYASFTIPYRQFLQSKYSREEWRHLLQFGGYAMLREATSAVSSRISLFYASTFISIQHTAWLGVSQRFAQLFLLPNQAMQSILFPGLVEQVNKNNTTQAKLLFHQTLSQLIAFTLPLALVVVCASSYLLSILHGKAYSQAWYLLSIYVIVAAVITPFGTAFGSIVTAIGKPYLATRIVMVNSIINIGLGYVLMKTWGLPGAPAAMLITEIFGLCWLTHMLRKEAGIDILETWQYVIKNYTHLVNLFKTKIEKIVIVKYLWK